MSTANEIDFWLNRLAFRRVNPFVRENLGTALDFFRGQMPALEDATKEDFLRGIDLHKPVHQTMLQPGEKLAAYRQPGEAIFKLFYTRPGIYMDRLGINPADRRFVRFRVRLPVSALVSTASAVRDHWTMRGVTWQAGGGGLQFIIPHAQSALEESCPARL